MCILVILSNMESRIRVFGVACTHGNNIYTWLFDKSRLKLDLHLLAVCNSSQFFCNIVCILTFDEYLLSRRRPLCNSAEPSKTPNSQKTFALLSLRLFAQSTRWRMPKHLRYKGFRTMPFQYWLATEFQHNWHRYCNLVFILFHFPIKHIYKKLPPEMVNIVSHYSRVVCSVNTLDRWRSQNILIIRERWQEKKKKSITD